MRPSRNRRHHPLAAAGTALEHIVLRHFGFQLIRDGAKKSPGPAKDAGDGAQV